MPTTIHASIAHAEEEKILLAIRELVGTIVISRTFFCLVRRIRRSRASIGACHVLPNPRAYRRPCRVGNPNERSGRLACMKCHSQFNAYFCLDADIAVRGTLNVFHAGTTRLTAAFAAATPGSHPEFM